MPPDPPGLHELLLDLSVDSVQPLLPLGLLPLHFNLSLELCNAALSSSKLV